MNKLFLILFLLTITAFPQDHKNILNLKEEIKQNINTTNSLSLPVQQEVSKKKVGLAIIYSLLLPGMGELYAGNYTTGKYFTIAEGALWGTFIGMNTYGSWQKSRYKSYAASNAGVNNAGKDDDYYSNISLYLNINDYNDDMARNGEFNKMYNTEQKYWQWTAQDRRTYRAMWVSSESAYNNVRFVVGAMVLNRVISAINAVRLTIAYNKNVPQDLGWNVTAGVSEQVNLPTSLIINFQTNF
jgi:hypothetical protein